VEIYMEDDLNTIVTRINNKYHIRLYKHDEVVSEMACASKLDIGFCCAELLRWYSKMGGVSKMAEASRNRCKKTISPVGKIWYENELNILKGLLT